MSEVFIKKQNKAQPGFSVGVLLKKKETKGAVGIEIEIEGTKLPKHETKPPWTYHHDGSLRGKDNAEYVLASPIEFEEVPAALAMLWGQFKEMKSVLDDSNRTSVHVHLNCQQFHLNRLTSLMAFWFVFEEILTAWCGEHRVGNLFCLRAVDAPAIISQVKQFIKSDGSYQLRDHLHYAGMNANALGKFGSLEFRTLRGCTDPQAILDWVCILERLYRLSAEFQDPRDICAMFSSQGPVAFFENALGEMAPVIRKALPDMATIAIEEAMLRGIRLAQDLCYCRDWDIFNPVELKADPFGRDARVVMKKIGGVDITAALAALDESPTWQMATAQPVPSPGYDPDLDIEIDIDYD